MHIPEDKKTVNYFDKQRPRYYLGKIEYATNVIRTYCKQDSSLVDIGCGTGNILKFIKEQTPVGELCGIDASKQCLSMTRETLDCKTYLGSILDTDFVERIPEKFDFAVLSAVLHHLIGKSRRESFSYGLLAISNSLRLLKEDGLLIIAEPVFYPRLAMDILFYVKKFMCVMTSRRIYLFSKDNNIGAPVVSYYTNEQLVAMVSRMKNCRIVGKDIQEKKLSFLMRFALITRRTDTTLVIEKTGRPNQG